jgi:hypothetical protein
MKQTIGKEKSMSKRMIGWIVAAVLLGAGAYLFGVEDTLRLFEAAPPPIEEMQP